MPEPGASPGGPRAPAPRPRKRHSVRQSVRVFLRRRGLSIRRRRRQEKISLPMAGLAGLVFLPLFLSWDWLWDPELPWINMGRSRSVFPVMLAVALVVWLIFIMNLADVLRAYLRAEEKAKDEEQNQPRQ